MLIKRSVKEEVGGSQISMAPKYKEIGLIILDRKAKEDPPTWLPQARVRQKRVGFLAFHDPYTQCLLFRLLSELLKNKIMAVYREACGFNPLHEIKCSSTSLIQRTSHENILSVLLFF